MNVFGYDNLIQLFDFFVLDGSEFPELGGIEDRLYFLFEVRYPLTEFPDFFLLDPIEFQLDTLDPLGHPRHPIGQDSLDQSVVDFELDWGERSKEVLGVFFHY